MQRFILFIILLFLSLPTVEAQQDHRFSQGVITETKMITRKPKRVKPEKVKKEYQKFDANIGFQQYVTAGWYMAFTYEEPFHSALNISYIGGYRFHDYFFAGVGAGLDVGTGNIFRTVTKGDFLALPMQLVRVPLFANLKAYFTKTKISPYLSFYAGARFSTSKGLEVYDENEKLEEVVKYGAIKPFFGAALGVNYRLSERRNIMFQVGFRLSNMDSARELYNAGSSMYMYDMWFEELAFSVGITF